MKRTIVLVAMLMLLSAIVARADNTYMPVVRETGGAVVRVHVIACPAWPGQEEAIGGRRVTVSDGGGIIIGTTTTARGDAIMQAELPKTVTVALDTGQSVTVRREDTLAVAFWVGRCATEAVSGGR